MLSHDRAAAGAKKTDRCHKGLSLFIFFRCEFRQKKNRLNLITEKEGK